MSGGALRRAVAAAALAVVALPAAPSAAADTGLLVLSGRGAVSVDVTLPTVRVVPMEHAGTVDWNGNRLAEGWTWQGCGGIRGFYLRPLTGDPMSGVGAADFAALRWGSPTDLPWPGGHIRRLPTPLGARLMGLGAARETAVTLPAGRYRAFLLGEGDCQVRITLGGYRGTIRARAARAAALQYAVAPLDLHGDLALPRPRAGLMTAPVVVRPRTLSMAFVHRVGIDSANGQFVPASVHFWSACVERDASPRCTETVLTSPRQRAGMYGNGMSGLPPRLPAGPTYAPNGPWPTSTQIGYWYAPGWLPAGELTGKVMAVSTPTTTSLQGVTFALDV